MKVLILLLLVSCSQLSTLKTSSQLTTPKDTETELKATESVEIPAKNYFVKGFCSGNGSPKCLGGYGKTYIPFEKITAIHFFEDRNEYSLEYGGEQYVIMRDLDAFNMYMEWLETR